MVNKIDLVNSVVELVDFFKKDVVKVVEVVFEII